MKFLKFSLLIYLILFISKISFANEAFLINNREIPKSKILFVGFDQHDAYLRAPAFEIMERIRINLKTTDLFEVIKQEVPAPVVKFDERGNALAVENSFAQIDINQTPDFVKYGNAKINAVVLASFNRDVSGNIEVRVRAFDILDQKQIFGKFYTASKDNYRKVANSISNEIFKSITGESAGHFDSEIAYIAEVGSVRNRIKKIAKIDFDGENHQYLTNGRELVLTPIFSGKRDEIYYVRYFYERPQIFALNTQTLRSEKLGGFKITTFSPAIHPKNDNLVLLSAIQDGNSDIYEINISENTARRFTKSAAIDTTPSYSPDGKMIVFASDRSGAQQIYSVTIDGFSLKQISKGAGSYSKPIYSPDGKLIAFTKMSGGKFYIGVMLADGSSERILSSGYLVEGAKFSKSGRHIVFSRKKGPYGKDSIPRLIVVDVLTGFEYELPTPENEGATDPDWK
jgi:TolB protein